MKASIHKQYGGPEVLHTVTVPDPKPGPKELLIRVHASEVTKSDTELRSFRFPVKWFWLPLRLALGLWHPRRPIRGSYFAGEVVATGAEADPLPVGTRVFGTSGFRFSAHAELLCLDTSSTVVPIPEDISWETAAASLLGGLNAMHFARLAQFRRGSRVLIHGAGGSIGVLLLQLARAAGAEVTAIDAKHKLDWLNRLGAQSFDYQTVDWGLFRESFDVVLNLVAQADFFEMLRTLRPGGRYIMVNPKLSDMLLSLIAGPWHGREALFRFAPESKTALTALAQLLQAKILAPPVDSCFPLEAAAAAHQRVEQEARLGAVLLIPSSSPS